MTKISPEIDAAAPLRGRPRGLETGSLRRSASPTVRIRQTRGRLFDEAEQDIWKILRTGSGSVVGFGLVQVLAEMPIA